MLGSPTLPDLNSRVAAYISVGQLHLVPIGFKLKSNGVYCYDV